MYKARTFYILVEFVYLNTNLVSNNSLISSNRIPSNSKEIIIINAYT